MSSESDIYKDIAGRVAEVVRDMGAFVYVYVPIENNRYNGYKIHKDYLEEISENEYNKEGFLDRLNSG